MKTKYLFFDYDGTLCDYWKPVTETVIASLNAARSAGHKIFMCSGRCRYMLPDFENIVFDGYVRACGSDIRIGDRQIIEHLIDPLILHDCVETAAKKGGPTVAEGLLAVKMNGVVENWECPSVNDFDEFIEKYGREKFNKFSIAMPCDDEIVKCAEKAGFYFINHSHSGEFVPFGYSKEQGIKAVLDHFGADVSDSIAFGDSMNDYSMIRFAGTGVAMGNGVDDLKKISDFVTKDVTEDGVAYFINNYLL